MLLRLNIGHGFSDEVIRELFYDVRVRRQLSHQNVLRTVSKAERASTLLAFGARIDLKTDNGRSVLSDAREGRRIFGGQEAAHAVVLQWAHGTHDLQKRRKALERELLNVSKDFPVDVARFVGEYVHI